MLYITNKGEIYCDACHLRFLSIQWRGMTIGVRIDLEHLHALCLPTPIIDQQSFNFIDKQQPLWQKNKEIKTQQ